MVGDENYGEGSSREHAAMSQGTRRGSDHCTSIARIHREQFEEQGVLPLTFMDGAELRAGARRGQDQHFGALDPCPGSIHPRSCTTPMALRTGSRSATPSTPSRSSGSRPFRLNCWESGWLSGCAGSKVRPRIAPPLAILPRVVDYARPPIRSRLSRCCSCPCHLFRRIFMSARPPCGLRRLSPSLFRCILLHCLVDFHRPRQPKR